MLVFKRADAAAALAIARDALAGCAPDAAHVRHWQARTVRVETPAPQAVQGDGNIIAQSPVRARVLPGALPVIVPESASVLETPSLKQAA